MKDAADAVCHHAVNGGLSVVGNAAPVHVAAYGIATAKKSHDLREGKMPSTPTSKDSGGCLVARAASLLMALCSGSRTASEAWRKCRDTAPAGWKED